MEFIIGRLRATFLYFIALFIRKSSHPTILCMNWHDSCRLCCMKFREECHMVIQLAHCSTCSGRYQCTVHTTIFVLIICLQIHLTHKSLLKLYFAHARDHTARVYSTRQCVSLHQFAEQQKLSVTFHSSAVFVWRIDIGRTAPPQSVTWAAHIHYTCRCRNAYYASDTQRTHTIARVLGNNLKILSNRLLEVHPTGVVWKTTATSDGCTAKIVFKTVTLISCLYSAMRKTSRKNYIPYVYGRWQKRVRRI